MTARPLRKGMRILVQCDDNAGWRWLRGRLMGYAEHSGGHFDGAVVIVDTPSRLHLVLDAAGARWSPAP